MTRYLSSYELDREDPTRFYIVSDVFDDAQRRRVLAEVRLTWSDDILKEMRQVATELDQFWSAWSYLFHHWGNVDEPEDTYLHKDFHDQWDRVDDLLENLTKRVQDEVRDALGSAQSSNDYAEILDWMLRVLEHKYGDWLQRTNDEEDEG